MGSSASKIVFHQGLQWLECSSLSRLPWLIHAFSTRIGGVSKPPAKGLNLGFIASDDRDKVAKNRKLFCEALRAGHLSLAAVRQQHSDRPFLVHRQDLDLQYCPFGYALPSEFSPTPLGDILFTCTPGILLSIRTADCLPVLLVDLKRRAVGAVHAGWRGLLAHILEKAVGEMRCLFGSRPSNILAAVGPSIRACCYEVGPEVVDAFSSRFVEGEKFFSKASATNSPVARERLSFFVPFKPLAGEAASSATAYLDLVAAARAQLKSGGVRPSNIEVVELCTACRTDLFFSHREEGASTGRMMAVIGIRPGQGD